MSPISPAHRRAEEFASLLEGRGSIGTRHADALALVGALRSVVAPQPSASYVNELRSNLLAAADTALVAVAPRLTIPTRTAARPRHHRKVAVAMGTLALLGGTTGVAMAAQSALPGESLYPIKRILESAQTSLSADDAARADRMMELAGDRLGEARALADSDSAGSRAQIPDTLADFVAQASQAADALLGDYSASGDVDSIVELRDFIRDSLDALAGLKSSVPAEYAADFDAAVNALLSLDERVLSTCGGCGGLLDIPAILLSGAPIQPRTSAGAATDPSSDAKAPATNAVTDLLERLPALGATPSPQASASPTPKPGTTTSPSLTPTSPLDGLLGDGSLTEPLTDAVEGLIDPLLDPLLNPILGSDSLR